MSTSSWPATITSATSSNVRRRSAGEASQVITIGRGPSPENSRAEGSSSSDRLTTAIVGVSSCPRARRAARWASDGRAGP